MDLERDQRAFALLGEALALAPEQRDAFLSEACGDDAELRAELERMLAQQAGLPPDAAPTADPTQQPIGTTVPLGDDDDDREPPSVIFERLRDESRGSSRYRRGEVIAEGGMGTVREVRDTLLGRRVAMKTIRKLSPKLTPPGPATSSKRVARFVEEAQISGKLDHPGIVPTYDLGLDDAGQLYFTMRLVRGEEFSRIIERVHADDPEWGITRALGALLKVCEAMAYAHSKGVIHRDLKPANVMVGRFGETYVMDWGLAKVLGQDDIKDIRLRAASSTSLSMVESELRGETPSGAESPLVTMDGDVLGTPAYMSPEQAAGRLEEMSPASDVYSLGAMLYQLTTGQEPYAEPGRKQHAHSVLARIATEPPRRIQEHTDRVPPELVAICEKAMSRAPTERYADTLAMAEDLRAFLERRVVKAYETGAFAEFKNWVRRNRITSAIVGLTLLVVLAGLIAVISVQDEAKREIGLNSDLYRVHYLIDAADELWPALPETIPDMQAWLADARALQGRKGIHEERLERSREATAQTDAPPGASESDNAGGLLSRAQQLQAGQQADLIDGIDVLADVVARVEARLDFANTVGDRTVSSEEAHSLWADAIGAIAASPHYGGLEITPQLGLIPVGEDPDTGLWEFTHVQTGELPKRDRDGKLLMIAETALVFVLIPGGDFEMGSNLPELKASGPVHPLELDPFFLSKYEMTQAQWMAIDGSNPSSYFPGFNFGGQPFTLLHPVETLTWADAAQGMQRLGLQLPTEAQWEYAARAGMTSDYWVGDDFRLLDGAVNLADRYCKEHDGPPSWVFEEWMDDGWTATAPVGEYRANDFGLHDVSGNVWEWCRDWFGTYNLDVQDGDGLREAPESVFKVKVTRGGAYYHTRGAMLVAYRYPVVGYPNASGVRPARAIEP